MSEQFLDPFEKYQYLAFKWILFVIFLVTAFEILDKHIHLKRLARMFLKWMLARFKNRSDP